METEIVRDTLPDSHLETEADEEKEPLGLVVSDDPAKVNIQSHKKKYLYIQNITKKLLGENRERHWCDGLNTTAEK